MNYHNYTHEKKSNKSVESANKFVKSVLNNNLAGSAELIIGLLINDGRFYPLF